MRDYVRVEVYRLGRLESVAHYNFHDGVFYVDGPNGFGATGGHPFGRRMPRSPNRRDLLWFLLAREALEVCGLHVPNGIGSFRQLSEWLGELSTGYRLLCEEGP